LTASPQEEKKCEDQRKRCENEEDNFSRFHDDSIRMLIKLTRICTIIIYANIFGKVANRRIF
jgi:hypothetical protein